MPASTTPITPEIRLLGAQIRAKDAKAIARVVSLLRRNQGDLGATIEALGVKRSTWHRWTKEVPEFAEAIAGLVRGPGGQHTLLTFRGQTKPIGQWCAELGINRSTLSMRLANGVPLERAMTPGPLRETTTPKKKAKRRAK